MFKIRLTLSKLLMKWGVQVNPDPYLRSRLTMALHFAAHIIETEVSQIDDEDE
jgi:hypothetical protein